MELKEDCSNCTQLKQIKALSRQVLKKYDELLQKFKENEAQYNVVVNRLKEREAMIEEMKKLIEPAMLEHERLMIKYDIELTCRTEAENVARKMTFQNQSLKRQSQALLSHLGKIDISQIPLEILEEPTEEDNDSYKDYTDNLNITIKDLEEKVSYYATALAKSREELSIEREDNIRLQQKNNNMKQSLQQTENTLTQYQNAMMELSTMSESAFEEYEHLKGKYEIEVKQRSETEKNMSKIKAQNEAMKTQSTILLSEVANDRQLTLALCKVEELEEDKSNLQSKIDELEDKLSESSKDRLVELEEEKSKLSEEIEDLMKKVSNYEQMYASLKSKYEELEKKLEEALKPPPPPPPPLPPPPPTTQSKGFLSKIGHKKKKKHIQGQAGGSEVQEGYGKALEEMMKRIHSGKPLTKSLKPAKARPLASEVDKSGAMKELHSVLNRFKTTRSESDSPKGYVSTMDPETDLAKAFRRVKGSMREDVFD